MTKAGLAKFKEIEMNSKKLLKAKTSKKKLFIPPDLKKELMKNKKAWENFNNFALSYKKLYIRWIADAKRKETRGKRIKQTVIWSAQNKKPGMM